MGRGPKRGASKDRRVAAWSTRKENWFDPRTRTMEFQATLEKSVWSHQRHTKQLYEIEQETARKQLFWKLSYKEFWLFCLVLRVFSLNLLKWVIEVPLTNFGRINISSWLIWVSSVFGHLYYRDTLMLKPSSSATLTKIAHFRLCRAEIRFSQHNSYFLKGASEF